MDVNNINNNLNPLNNSTSLPLSKVSGVEQIQKIDEDSLKLTVNNYNQRRDELSTDVQLVNEGIAKSAISLEAIDKQKEYLSNIQDKIEKADNYQDKNDLKSEINEDLRNFNKIAYETKFKNENLLITDEEDLSIEINTSENNFLLDKLNTAQFTNDIFEQVNNFDLNDPNNLANLSQKVGDSYEQLSQASNKLSDFSNNLIESAKSNIQEQQSLYSNNIPLKQTDFPSEASDFTKSNIQVQQGYLAASQANIIQEQTVRLLS